MALNDLTGQRIKNTYERLVQTDGTQYADGTGSLLDIASTADIAQLLNNATAAGNVLTFTREDGSTFDVPVITDTGSFVTGITFSNPNIQYFLANGSAISFSIQNLTSNQGFVNAANISVLQTSASNALYTASVSSNTITFEKGDGTTFPITIDTGSGIAPGEVVDDLNGLSGSVDLVAGPNITINSVGNSLEISGSIGGGGVSSVNSATGAITISAGPNITVNTVGTDVQITGSAGGSVDTGSLVENISFTNPNLIVTEGDGTVTNVNLQSLQTTLGTTNTISIANNFASIGVLQTSASNALYTASAAGNTITFEKGDGSTFDVSVTGGGGTTDTGSLLTTASADYSQITFTKGDGSTFDIDTTPNQLIASVKNISGGTLAKGTPVHVTASASPPSGFLSEVVAADAGDAGLMPAHYILGEELIDGAEGVGIISGKIQGVDTQTPGFSEGDTIYVAVGGGYTNTKPTGSTNLIQNIGVVTKIDNTNGGGEVFGAGRTNDLPNLLQNYVWIGGPGDVPTFTQTVPKATEANAVLFSTDNTDDFQPILYARNTDLPGYGAPRYDAVSNPGELQFRYNPSETLLQVENITSSFANITSITGSLLGDVVGTASFADNATSASFATTATSASHALKADQADQIYVDIQTVALDLPVLYTDATTPGYDEAYYANGVLAVNTGTGKVKVYTDLDVGDQLEVQNSITVLTGDITASGVVTSSDAYINDWGSISASLATVGADQTTLGGEYLQYYTRTAAYGNGSYEGEIVYYGSTTTSTGKTYVWNGTIWAESDANIENQTRGLFGIALGTNSGTNGMLIGGFRAGTPYAGFTAGNQLFISTTAGTISPVAPRNAGEFQRCVGQALGNAEIRLDVSNDYYEIG